MDRIDLTSVITALSAYAFDQKTLQPVVDTASTLWGEEWISSLPSALEESKDIPPEKHKVLEEKANHAIHYFGALAAWEEAQQYLANIATVNPEILTERIPTLEYWLALFGQEGNALIDKLKKAHGEMLTPSQVSLQQPDDEQNAENEQNQDTENPVQQTTSPLTDNVQDMSQTSDTQPIESDAISSSDSFVVDEVENEGNSKEGTADVPLENSEQEETYTQEDIPSDQVNNAPVENVPPSTSRDKTEVITPQKNEDLSLVQPASTDGTEKETIPENSLDAKVEEEGDVVFPPEDATLEESEQGPEESVEIVEDMQETIEDLSIETTPTTEMLKESSNAIELNLDIKNFLKEKNLYDQVIAWVGARCVHENIELGAYPHYGFVIDLMSSLKYTIQTMLNNPLLDEVIEMQLPEGRQGLNKLLDALTTELAPFFEKQEEINAEQARTLLGQMDDSKKKEYFGPAPDGFELMDNPYNKDKEQEEASIPVTNEEFDKEYSQENASSPVDNQKEQEKGQK